MMREQCHASENVRHDLFCLFDDSFGKCQFICFPREWLKFIDFVQRKIYKLRGIENLDTQSECEKIVCELYRLREGKHGLE